MHVVRKQNMPIKNTMAEKDIKHSSTFLFVLSQLLLKLQNWVLNFRILVYE